MEQDAIDEHPQNGVNGFGLHATNANGRADPVAELRELRTALAEVQQPFIQQFEDIVRRHGGLQLSRLDQEAYVTLFNRLATQLEVRDVRGRLGLVRKGDRRKSSFRFNGGSVQTSSTVVVPKDIHLHPQ